jgi:hypothetical protein
MHAADTDYHHEPDVPRPAEVPGSLKLNPPKPVVHVRRAWTLAARLTVAVLIIGLAAVTALSLISLRTVSVRASKASVMASAEAGTIASMGRQLAQLQAKVGAPVQLPKPYRPPAILQHYGVCVAFGRDTSSGALVNVNLSTPQVNGGQVSCPQGTLVSVVPGG